MVGAIVGAGLTYWLGVRGRREQRIYEQRVRDLERAAGEWAFLQALGQAEIRLARQMVRDGAVLLDPKNMKRPFQTEVGFEATAGCCRVGSEIKMADGSWRRVEELQQHEVIRTYSVLTHVESDEPIANIRAAEHESVVVINRSIAITPTQDVLADGRFLTAADLRLDARLTSEAHKAVGVSSLEELTGTVRVYGIELSFDSGYFVRGADVKYGILVREARSSLMKAPWSSPERRFEQD